MPEAPQSQLDMIRAQLERGTYDVDPEKVADAIVARLLAGRTSRERLS